MVAMPRSNSFIEKDYTMTEATARVKAEVKVSEDQSTLTLGNATVEVSSDGKRVTASAPDGFEVKAAASTEAATEGTKISISKDFNAVVLNGVTIEKAADGHLVITAPGGTVINKPAPANDTAKDADGWVCIGNSVDTGKPLYVAPADAGIMPWDKAMKAGEALGAHLPTKGELNQIFNAKAKLSGLDVTGSLPSGWYWSSSPYDSYGDCARVQRLSDGCQDGSSKSYGLSVRLVRS